MGQLQPFAEHHEPAEEQGLKRRGSTRPLMIALTLFRLLHCQLRLMRSREIRPPLLRQHTGHGWLLMVRELLNLTRIAAWLPEGLGDRYRLASFRALCRDGTLSNINNREARGISWNGNRSNV